MVCWFGGGAIDTTVVVPAQRAVKRPTHCFISGRQ
jgi:hypothetical protein